MNQRIQELQRELRAERKKERKEKAKRLGHAPKKSGRSYFEGEHEYLADGDWLAKVKRRIEIFRNAGGEVTFFDESDPYSIEEIRPANCQGCSETHLVGWSEGEWSHPKSHGERRCDCAACALFVCRPWHKAHHNREVKFSGSTREG